MSMIIGLTGRNCAGKGEVAEYLKKRGFYYLSLSDIIREELASECKEVSREALCSKGNDLRKEFGPSVLAKRVIQKMEPDKNYIIDSIRSPAEVEELKKLKNFFLLFVTAAPEIRFERMKERGRESDPKTLEEFKRLEEAEAKNPEEYKLNLDETEKKSNASIRNNGSLEELNGNIDSALQDFFKKADHGRPSWDEYFMNIAKVVASRSNCVKRKVAAVIVRDKRIVSTGYNGTPRGTKNCNEGGCPRCNSFSESGKNLEECFCSHGEENAIVQASYHGIALKDSVIYTTYSPCLLCTKMIINSGIKEVVYNQDYPLGGSALKLLEEAQIVVRKVKV